MFDMINLSVILSPAATLELHIPIGAILYLIFTRTNRK